MIKIIFSIVLSFFVLGILGIIWKSSQSDQISRQTFPEVLHQLQNSVAQDQLPFQELTVPYLQAKTYPGSQIQILSEYSQNSRFTSYRASYESDGLTIYGLLTVPNGSKPDKGWPAVVFLHGYIPPAQYQTNERYVAYVDYLARNGLVVFKIDYRGHDQSEGQASGSYFGNGYVIDTLNAVSSLQQFEQVNPEAIGLWGHSMSGNVALRSMVSDQRIKAGVIWAGAVYSYQDLFELGLSDNSYVRPTPTATASGQRQTRQNIVEQVGEYSADNTFWQQLAPINYLNSDTGAIQLHHAVNDSTVNVEYSRRLVPALEAANVTHEYYEYQSGGHDIEGAAFNQAMARTVEFFQEHLTTK